MTIAGSLRIVRLTLPVSGYEPYTYPRLWRLLNGEVTSQVRDDVVAVGAELDGKPIGLALLSELYDADRRRLWSISVARQWRRQGIGHRLLATGESLARSLGTQRLLAYHSSRMPDPSAFVRLLQAAGWHAPVPFEYRLAGRARWVFDGQRDWQFLLKRLARHGYSATAWTERTGDDRACIQQLASDQRVCPPHLNPATFDAHAEPAVSIVIRQHGQAVGWVIGHRRDPAQGEEVIHYSCGWVIPALSRSGWLIGGVMEVCRRQAAVFGPESLSIFETRPDNLAMRRFMWERLKPAYALWTDIRYVSEKALAADSPRQPPPPTPSGGQR